MDNSNSISSMARVQIVGAGVAGFTLTRELIQRGYRGEIVLCDPQGLPYDRPPLSKALRREYFMPASWYAEHGVQLRTEAINDPALPEAADEWLVLATGSRAKKLTVPGAEHALSLHTADEAELIARRLDQGMFAMPVAIIGAGLVGAEFASAARQAGAQVTLYSASSAPLARVLGEEMARELHAAHRRNGVTCVDAAVTEVGPDYVVAAGQRHEAALIVAAVGAEADTTVAEGLGLVVDDGILVDDAQRVIGQQQVLAIGDAARRVDHPRAVHWEAAMDDAAIAAAVITGQPAPSRKVDWFWSDRHDAHVEVVGDFTRASSHISRLGRRGNLEAVFGLDSAGNLVAASMVDGGLLSKALRRLMDAGVTPTAEQLADPSVGPRELAKAGRS